MSELDLFKLYERLYFDELERRERISARLNLPFALLLAQFGFLSLMLEGAWHSRERVFAQLFWILFLLATVATIVAAWCFRKAWFGFTDKLLPTANATERYRQELLVHYKDYEDSEQLVQNALKLYLYTYYMQFSSVNAVNNDTRSFKLYQSNVSLAVAVVLASLAYVLLLFGRS